MIPVDRFSPGPRLPLAAQDRRSLDRVFKALASDVRRDILDALRDGPKATGELVLLFPELSRFAVMQHLKVLAKARLVVTRKRGRVRHNFLNAVPIRELYERWVSGYEGLWAGGLLELRRRAETPHAGRGQPPARPRPTQLSRGARP